MHQDIKTEADRSRPSIKTTPLRAAPAYRIEELAAAGPICRARIYTAIREGRLTARKAGGSTIILARDWLEFLESFPVIKASV